MARLTVEDCLAHIDNRYDLTVLAAKRARQLTMGMEPLVESDDDKPAVIALREIAQNLITEDNIDDIGKQSSEYSEFETAAFDIPRRG